MNCKISNSSMNIFFSAIILGLCFFILFVGVGLEIRRNILPFFVRCFFACFKNLTDISSPCFPPVVAICEDFGSLLSKGRYGALKVIRSYLFLMFLKRLDLIALNPFLFRSFTDFGLMSTVVIFFLSRNFDAVSARIPEPVPMSRYETFLFLDKYFFKKFAKKYESSAG